MDKNLLNIGLTGSRFSGKNSIATLFRQLGVPVFDADAVMKYILNYRKSMPESVSKAFGREYAFGEYINPIAFDTDEKIEKLIDLIEFELFEAYDRFRNKNSESQYTIFHSSIIFEKNWNKKFDRVITVYSPKNERIERYRNSTGEKLEVIHSLFSKEINELHKNQSSDHIIHNYMDAPDILKQIENIDTKIVDFYITLNKKNNIDDFSYQSSINNILTF